jgi:hypothetical protein
MGLNLFCAPNLTLNNSTKLKNTEMVLIFKSSQFFLGAGTVLISPARQ